MEHPPRDATLGVTRAVLMPLHYAQRHELHNKKITKR